MRVDLGLLSQRIATWTEELRQKAEIVGLLDEPRPLDRLPPAGLPLEADALEADVPEAETPETEHTDDTQNTDNDCDDPTGEQRPWRPTP